MGQKASLRGKLTIEILKILFREQEKCGVSSAELASKSGLSAPVISRLRTFQRSLNVEEFERLSSALQVTASDVVAEAEEALLVEEAAGDVSSLRAVEKVEVSAPEPEATPASSSCPVYDDAFYARIDDIAAHPENYDLAAMEHEPDPYEGLGEESQLTPGWDED